MLNSFSSKWELFAKVLCTPKVTIIDLRERMLDPTASLDVLESLLMDWRIRVGNDANILSLINLLGEESDLSGYASILQLLVDDLNRDRDTTEDFVYRGLGKVLLISR